MFLFFKRFLIKNEISGLRVEFCKAYVRVRRWNEQVRLLRAEMGYCLASLEYQSKQWEQRAEVQQFSGDHAEGAAAYAHKQAAVFCIVADNFRALWAGYGVESHLESMTAVGSLLVHHTLTATNMQDGVESDDEFGGSDLEENDDQEPEGIENDDNGEDAL